MNTAIIVLSYKRDARLLVSQIVKQSLPDSEIFVWHNHPSNLVVYGATNIYADKNFGCSIRQFLALAVGADYTMFLDDDVSLTKPGVLEAFLAVTKGYKYVAGEGRILQRRNDKPYSEGKDASGGTLADVGKGNCVCVETELIKSMLHVGEVKGLEMHDDIWMSAAIELYEGTRPFILGTDEVGVEIARNMPFALSTGDNWLADRDKACGVFLQKGWLQ